MGSRLSYLEHLEYLLFGLSILQRQILILFRDILALLSGPKEVDVLLLARIHFKLGDDEFEICLCQYGALAWEVGFDHLEYGLATMLLVYLHEVNFERGTILTEDVQFDLPLLTLGLLTLFRQRRLGSPSISDFNFLTDLPECGIFSELAVDGHVQNAFQDVWEPLGCAGLSLPRNGPCILLLTQIQQLLVQRLGCSRTANDRRPGW